MTPALETLPAGARCRFVLVVVADRTRLGDPDAAKRTEAERLEALADGICDCLLAHVMERRSRPAEIVHQPWLDKQWGKVVRALDVLNAFVPSGPARSVRSAPSRNGSRNG